MYISKCIRHKSESLTSVTYCMPKFRPYSLYLKSMLASVKPVLVWGSVFTAVCSSFQHFPVSTSKGVFILLFWECGVKRCYVHQEYKHNWLFFFKSSGDFKWEAKMTTFSSVSTLFPCSWSEVIIFPGTMYQGCVLQLHDCKLNLTTHSYLHLWLNI